MYVIQLLARNGKFVWYNGLGADRKICYDVNTQVPETDLYGAGFDTTWEDTKSSAGLHGSKQWE